MSGAYRIEFSIKRRQDGEDDFTEVGFGSSFDAELIDSALYDVQSIVQNRQWETSGDMPDPDSLVPAEDDDPAEEGEVPCHCVGLSHRATCPNWVLPL